MRSILSWSGGKDSALALYESKNDYDLDIVSLLTTVTEDYERVSIHGVREDLLIAQSKNLGIPLEIIYIPTDCSNEEYSSIMQNRIIKLKKRGIHSVIFGDIFLEDIRQYRERNLSKVDMKPIFPLWNRSTERLAKRFIDLGFKAVITCIDSEFLERYFIGREYNEELLSNLPDNVDPCGENGEFHTFVYDGPIFDDPISLKLGKVEVRDDRFYFKDILIKDAQK